TLGDRPAPPPPVRRGAYLGIVGQPISAGIELTQVFPEGPAGKAGLKKGDVIVAVEKKKVANLMQLQEQLRGKKPGDKVTLEVLQGKKARDVSVTLGKPPVQPGRPPRFYATFLGGQQENAQQFQGTDGYQYGGVYKSTDGGDSWTRVNSVNPRPMYFSQVRVDPSDDKRLYVCGIALYQSEDGGKKFVQQRQGVHDDRHALWINPKDGRHMIIGCDGGGYVTYDRMQHWDFLNQMAIGQFYHVTVDNRQPYHVYGGLQDNGSWGGPSRGLDGRGPINADWIFVAGGDGFVCRVDANDPDLVYAESQDGAMQRRHLRSGQFRFLRPQPPQGKSYRWNWNTPFILSSHNSRIFYSA